MTKYEGTSADFKGKYFLTGYYRIAKTADLKRQHIRYLSDYSCLDEDVCQALRAEEVRFVRIEDAFEITEKVVKQWGGKGKITRQTRFLLNEEQTTEVLEFLQSKNDATQEYIAETVRLQPHSSAEEGEQDEE